jgi:hypothetical protein
MSIYFHYFETIKSRIDYIYHSFQSQFWIDEHQWFIRYHWTLGDKYSQCILFYTWPYTFSDLSIANHPKAMASFKDNHWSSSRVHHLVYNSLLMEQNIPAKEIELENSITSVSKMNKMLKFNSRKTRSFCLSDDQSTIIPSSFEKTIKITSINPYLIETSPILQFPNIQKLTIQPPFDDYFWWIIPNLHRLTSLTIKSSTQNFNPSHLQTLLDRAPRLYSLNFHLQSKFLLSNLTSTSIRRLDLKQSSSSDPYSFFNHEQCIALTRSSLGKQCEVLLIDLRHRRSILFLIATMINLRALIVRCQDDQFRKKMGTEEEDELLHWLENHLSSTMTIERDIDQNLRLWIR